jgi:glutathione S-transferase
VLMMKLYIFPVAPNPARVVFCGNEKRRVLGEALNVEAVMVDLSKGEHKTAEFLKLNPLGTLPVLELDGGTTINESLAIMEYLEECFPEPCLIGTTSIQRADICSVERFIEMNLLLCWFERYALRHL